jgi:hypothetical protein
MVYSISYRPQPDSWPHAEQIGGDTDEMPLEDQSPDGGIGIHTSRYSSGRRLRVENAPTQVRWLSRRKLQDYESTRMANVSLRLRSLIEEIEPRIHQFIPVEFVAKDGSHLADRWFWQVGNRLDSVHRGKTNWQLPRSVWRSPVDEEPRLVFDLAKVGNAKFWHDKHIILGTNVTDETKARLQAEGMTGMVYEHYEQA